MSIDETVVDGDDVDVVYWSAPDPYFADFSRAGDENANFGLNLRAWKPFQIDAEVTRAAESTTFRRIVAFEDASPCPLDAIP